MHRTQIMIEESQYQALTSRARRERKSLSELVREAVDMVYGLKKKRQKTHTLDDIRGIFSDPGGISGRDHDFVLYGWDKSKFRK